MIANAIAEELKEEVVRLEKTQVVGDVRLTYSKGRGNTDYEACAIAHHPTPEMIAKFSKPDWGKICKEGLALGSEVLESYYTPGTPGCTIKIEE